jgi:hypothetical protein
MGCRTHLIERLSGAKYVYAVIAVHEKSSQTFFPVTLIAVLVVFLFRVLAVSEHWPSIVPLAATAAARERASERLLLRLSSSRSRRYRKSRGRMTLGALTLSRTAGETRDRLREADILSR